MFSFNITGSVSRWCAQRPWRTLAACLAVVLVSAWLASGIGDVLTTEMGNTVELESDTADRLVAERMDDDDVSAELIVIRSPDLTVDDPAFRDYVAGIVARVDELRPGTVATVIDYYAVGDEELVSESRRALLVPVVLAGPEDDLETQSGTLNDAVTDVRDPAFETYVTGEESIGRTFTEMAERDLLTAELIGLPVTLVVLAIVFGALVAAGIPVLVALLAILVAVGITALVGHQFTLSIFVVNVITMIGLAVGIDYSLFLVERFREERRQGRERIDAIAHAGGSAGRTVLFSGLTVIVALASMIVVPDTSFRSIAVGATTVVVVTVVASLTLLPAVLSLLGDRVNALRVPFTGRGGGTPSPGGFWDRTSHFVMSHPLPCVIVTVALLLAAALPYLDISLGFAGVSTLPKDTDAYRGFSILDEEFTGGLIEPAFVAVDAPDVSTPDIQAAIARLREDVEADDAFGATSVEIGERGDLAVVTVLIHGDPAADTAFDALDRLRTTYVPNAFDGVDARTYIGGDTASSDDYFALINRYTPIIFVFVLGLSFFVLLLVFRSLVVPVKALLMNLLSVGAAYGLLVLVFQHGVGTSLLGFQQVDRIEAWVPLFLFAVLFGLSMDYHVFLLSRIRERYDVTRDNRESIAFGIRSTASIITGAALIMVGVFAAFAMGDLVMMQQMGFGLAIAVAIDATIVRTVLVPATMVLLGDANWYLPAWLRWLPQLRIEDRNATPAQELSGATTGGGS